MKSARFSHVVQACGSPEVYLLFTEPTKDETFQQALKSNRIMTLHEKTSGAKTSFGTVGYDTKARGQLLLFPRSLKAFADSQIVGLKYDLFKMELSPATEAKSPPPAVKPPKQASTEKSSPVAEPVSAPPAAKPTPPSAKLIPFRKQTEKPSQPASDQDDEESEIKAQVRRAIKALEEGKQVAAFNLLKRIVEN